MRKTLLIAASIAFAFGAFLAACAAQASPVSQDGMAGAYAVSLKVLPAESFSGQHAEMAWDGGAKPDMMAAMPHPDHHMVVFVKKGGKAVENAAVTIRYRELKPHKGEWMSLPVARMHVAGKGTETTHYGNNLALSPGTYMVDVTVNGSKPAQFTFTLPAKSGD